MQLLGAHHRWPPAPRARPAGSAPAGTGFGVPSEAPTATPALGGTAATVPLASLQALVALQALPDATERRRRSVRRGGALLDRLDGIRLALLDGALPAETLSGCGPSWLAAREATDDPRLDGLLQEIEVRAEVELAKLEDPGGHLIQADDEIPERVLAGSAARLEHRRRVELRDDRRAVDGHAERQPLAAVDRRRGPALVEPDAALPDAGVVETRAALGARGQEGGVDLWPAADDAGLQVH